MERTLEALTPDFHSEQVKKQLKNVIEDRQHDIPFELKYERDAETAEKLKAEIGKVRTQYEDKIALLEEQLQQFQLFKHEQRLQENMEAGKETKKSVGQCKAPALLEKKVNILMEENKIITKERNALILKAQRLERKRDAMKIEMDALKSEAEISRRTCKEFEVLEEQLECVWKQNEEMKRQRDAAILETKLISRNRGTLIKERDRLKREVEKSRRQCEEFALMEGQVKALRVENDSLKKERNAKILQAQRIARNRNEIRKEMDEIKRDAENIRCQSKDFAVLEVQLSGLLTEHDEMRRQRDALKEERDTLMGRRNALVRERDALKREVENSREQYMTIALLEEEVLGLKAENNSMRKEFNSFIFKAQRQARNRDAIKNELDALKRETENYRREGVYVPDLVDQLNSVRMQHDEMGRQRDALQKELDALKPEAENLRRQCEDVAALEEQLNIARAECDEMKRERNAFISEQARNREIAEGDVANGTAWIPSWLTVRA
jgi:hypothetical protein